MRIIELKIDDLIPYENNPRFNEGAVAAVAASIEEFGFKVPVVVDKNHVIVAGHTRCKAARQLGYTSVPCIIADDLTEEQVKAFRLADNKTNELAAWDFAKLEEELRDLELDMTQFGFTVDDVKKELEVVNDEFDTGEAYDNIQEPITKYGDVWQLGQHRVICGDSTKPEDLDKLVGDEKVDLLITDPPYNVNYGKKGETFKKRGMEGNYGSDDRTILNDHMSDSNFREFLHDAFENANRVLRAGGAFYIWHADSERYNFQLACKRVGWQVRQNAHLGEKPDGARTPRLPVDSRAVFVRMERWCRSLFH